MLGITCMPGRAQALWHGMQERWPPTSWLARAGQAGPSSLAQAMLLNGLHEGYGRVSSGSPLPHLQSLAAGMHLPMPSSSGSIPNGECPASNTHHEHCNDSGWPCSWWQGGRHCERAIWGIGSRYSFPLARWCSCIFRHTEMAACFWSSTMPAWLI